MSDELLNIGMAERIEIWEIEKLKPYDKNARTHSDDQVKKIAASMTEFGFTNPILVDSDNGIIAGHGRLQAAKLLKLDKVPVIILDHLTEQQKRAYVLADNRLALDAGWDPTMLHSELEWLESQEFDLELTGFTEEELEMILEPPVVEPQEEDDKVPSLPIESKTKNGDLYSFGNHRLLCGDSGMIDEVERLMDGAVADLVFTDPPYGVSYSSNRKKSDKFDVIENDDKFISEWVNVLPIVSSGWVFVWTTWKVLKEWIEITSPIGKLSNMVIWDKGGGGIGDLTKTFSTDYEVALVYNRGAEITGKRLGSVWSIGKDGSSEYLHPTQKPVALAEMAIENCTNKKSNVLDLFGGSGSTMIACEKQKRNSFTMELDKKYCDIIISRWCKYTGNTTVVLNGFEIEWNG